MLNFTNCSSGNYSGKFNVFLVILAGFILLFLSIDASSAGAAALKIGDAPPQVSLPGLSGSIIRLPNDFRGKVVVLHFWAGGCSSCKEEMPAMETLYGTYAKKGLVILAVNVGQGRDVVKGLVQELGITYPVLLDTDKSMAHKYDVVGLPRTYIVDKKGVIRYKILGGASEEILKKRLLSLL
jgi:cytochrome c biogenesis protein CcmG/thiol:disulfide interchange protein DsbE